MTKKKNLPLLQNVTIADVAAEGMALARVDEMVVFVSGAVPGDVVDLQVKKKKHSYCEAYITRFVEKSRLRTQPFCQHFGTCGGCKWQMLPYEEQLRWKQKQVMDQLSRIGKIPLPECSPILGSEKTTCYRNKLEFGCSNKRWLSKEEIDSGVEMDRNAVGFHIPGTFDKILPIEKCWLMDDLHNAIRHEVYNYAVAHAFTFFDAREHQGLLRNIMIRNSAIGEWMVVLQFHFEHPEDEERARGLMAHLAGQFPQITSLMYVNNQKFNDTIGDLDIQPFSGKDHIYEVMEGLRFKVGPKSFYQTNTEQAYVLYSVARKLAGLTGSELVYDLYTGTGTIANFVARQARQVIGIEYVPDAIEDAKVNSQENNIDNTLFYAGDMKDVLNDEFISTHGRPDVIITDPPRAGMHPDVVKTIQHAAPQRIVYVSCNPATQARDIAALSTDYEVKHIQPVDMFPHTHHVENVVMMERK